MKAIILKRDIPGPRRGTRILKGARIKVSDAEAARLVPRHASYDDGVGYSKPAKPKAAPKRAPKSEPEG
jgi:hypothetical protein